MSRLYYAKPLARPGFTAGTDSKLSEWGEKVTKLIPAEIVAGYVTLVGLASKLGSFRTAMMWACLGACFVLTPLYLRKVAEPNKPMRNHLLVSAVAFLVWAYSVSGHLVVPAYYDAAAASIALVLFTLVSGVIPLDK